MFLLWRPSDNFIQHVVDEQRESQLTYQQIGLTRESVCPPGFSQNQWHSVIGNGEQAFARARNALSQWRMLNLGWIQVVSAPESVQEGGLVCTLARIACVYSLNVAKVVYIDNGESTHRFSFGYGTLPEYPISGEERFSVAFWPETGDVTFEIFSFSRAATHLTKLGRPLLRQAQRRFSIDSTAVMRAACQQ